MNMNRRRFLQAFGAAAAVSATPTVVRAAANPHVVVLGGGFAGATIAKYLRMWSEESIDVTLVDPNAGHVSCVLSNLVLNRRINLQELHMSHGSLSSFYGVNVIQDRAVGIDSALSQVTLAEGEPLTYQHLVIATGIEFQMLENMDFNLTPHAWIAGTQTQELANKVDTLGENSTFVMTIPKAPYRCPPGPYERACLVADILKRKGYDNGDAKVIVLDENPQIMAEEHTFSTAFSQLYGNIVDYRTNVLIEDVDSANGVVVTSGGDVAGDVINPIPRQQAMGFVRDSGLTNGGLWAPVDPLTYASTLGGFENVHIIGDGQGTGQPKSAHMANSQAKVCADAIIRTLADTPNDTEERMMNVTTNSACYSPITYDEASWLTANFSYDIATQAMKLSHIGEAERWSRGNYNEMFAWASNLFKDSFH